jgi:type II secretory pathway component PulK
MQIIQRRNTQGTFVRLGEVLLIPGINNQTARVIIDNLTVIAGTEIEGQININTASEAVLNTLPGITPDVASAIFQQQTSGFTSVGALLDVPGVNLITLGPIVDGLTVNTRTLIVRALGQYGLIRVAVEASVRIIDDTPRITSIRRLPPARAIGLWGWSDEATNDVEFGGIS